MKRKGMWATLLVAGVSSLMYMATGKFPDAVATYEEKVKDYASAPEEGRAEEPGRTGRADEGSSTASDATGRHRKLELPATARGELVLTHLAYTVSFNTHHNNPNWVAWELTAREAEGTGRRSNDFRPDPLLDERQQVTTEDYKGSGYDRGHMCPAADNKWDARAMTECFYMSNMCPQLHELNAGGWETLEAACRRWAKQEGSLLIVCGPVYDQEVKARQGQRSTRRMKSIGKEHRIDVPTGFFKCVMSLRKGHEKAIGFYYANTDARQTMESACMSVDEVESLTGYDFFVNVPSDLEERLEAECSRYFLSM